MFESKCNYTVHQSQSLTLSLNILIGSGIFKSPIWEELDSIVESTENEDIKKLARKLPQTLMESQSQNTVKLYGEAWNKFTSWCDKVGFSYRLPVRETVIALYLMQSAQTSSSVTKMNHIYYGIGWAHDMAGVNNPCKSNWLNLCLESLRRGLSKPPAKKQAITIDILKGWAQEILQKEEKCLKDWRIFCMCILMFAGFLRFSEAVELTLGDIVFRDSYLELFIQKSKTDVYRNGVWIVLVKSGLTTCPYSVLQTYIQIAGVQDSNEFLFRGISYTKKKQKYVLRPDKTRKISYTRARELILEKLKDLGLDTKQFGTHSFRSGGCTEAARQGIPDRLLKVHGRWKSEKAKDGYIQDDIGTKLMVTQALGL